MIEIQKFLLETTFCMLAFQENHTKAIRLSKVLSGVLTVCDPMDPPGSSAHGTVSGKNAGVGCHFLLQGNLPNLGIKPLSPILLHWQANSLPLSHLGSPVYIRYQYSSVQSLSRVWLFATPWTAGHQASLSITKSQSLPRLMPIESVMPSNHLILCRPLLLPPSIFPSIRVFSNESVLHIRWPKYWSFSFSISPSCVCSALISFRMDWFDLLPVQGTLKSLLQHHSSKASILWCSAFFIVQLVHPYMTPGKTIALTWLSKVWLSNNCPQSLFSSTFECSGEGDGSTAFLFLHFSCQGCHNLLSAENSKPKLLKWWERWWGRDLRGRTTELQGLEGWSMVKELLLAFPSSYWTYCYQIGLVEPALRS